MAFTDLHEEIESMFSLLEGQTFGLAAERPLSIHGGRGFYTCRSPNAPSDTYSRSRKRKWQAAWRKRNPELALAAARRQCAKRAAETRKRTKKTGRPATYEGRPGSSTERVRRHRERKAEANGLH